MRVFLRTYARACKRVLIRVCMYTTVSVDTYLPNKTRQLPQYYLEGKM